MTVWLFCVSTPPKTNADIKGPWRMVVGKYSIYIYTHSIYIYTLTFWAKSSFFQGTFAVRFKNGSLPCSFEKLISEGSHCLEHVLANDECWLLALAPKQRNISMRKKSCRRCTKKTGCMFWGFSDVTFWVSREGKPEGSRWRSGRCRHFYTDLLEENDSNMRIDRIISFGKPWPAHIWMVSVLGKKNHS